MPILDWFTKSVHEGVRKELPFSLNAIRGAMRVAWILLIEILEYFDGSYVDHDSRFSGRPKTRLQSRNQLGGILNDGTGKREQKEKKKSGSGFFGGFFFWLARARARAKTETN
jgi:hypothetical protein